jgi:hypothetical protein
VCSSSAVRLDHEGAVDETGMSVCGLLWSLSSCAASMVWLGLLWSSARCSAAACLGKNGVVVLGPCTRRVQHCPNGLLTCTGASVCA